MVYNTYFWDNYFLQTLPLKLRTLNYFLGHYNFQLYKYVTLTASSAWTTCVTIIYHISFERRRIQVLKKLSFKNFRTGISSTDLSKVGIKLSRNPYSDFHKIYIFKKFSLSSFKWYIIHISETSTFCTRCR